MAIPIAAMAIGYRAYPRFRYYLLRLHLRLLPAAQLWRVIGFAFLVANATGPALEPPALTTWPMAIFPTIMVPFIAVLHLVAVLQSRHDWEARARQFAIPSHALAPSPNAPAALASMR